MNCLLNALAMSFGLMCVLLLSCCPAVVVVCVLVRVWCSSRCLCFSCGPMVFRCVPSRCLSCLCLRGWRFLCLVQVCLGVEACFCWSGFSVLFCCECLVVGVCLCCESCLLECVSFLLGIVCW